MQSTSEIFFSYAWGDENEPGSGREKIVNDLYESLIADGYNVIRDKNDMRYKSLISALTDRIGRGKFIIVAISDKYLKSTYCMSELLEIYRRSNSDIEEMLKKIFPIVLNDAKIYNPEDSVDYLRFWEAKKEELNEKIKGVGLEYVATFAEDLRIYDEITAVIPILSKLLKDINTLNPQKLSANNFAEIKDAIIKTVLAEPPSIHAPPIIKPNTSAHVLKMPGRRVVITGLIITLLMAGLLYFVRVSTTEIRLELSLSEVNFTLPQQHILTNLIQLASIGASGLRSVQLPADSNVYSSSTIPAESSGSAVLLSVDTNASRRGTLTLDAIPLPGGMRIGIRHTDIDGGYRFSFEGKELTLPVQVNGFVKMALPPNTPDVLNFTSPGLINLQTDKDQVDLDLNFLSDSNTIFPGLIPADSISLLRIDQYIDNEKSIIRTVSTILSGTIYLESLPGKELQLQPGQQIRFEKSKGVITYFELQSNHIVLTFSGSVSGMRIGNENKLINLMPTYFQWFRARLSLSFLLVTILVLIALALGAQQLRRKSM